MCGGGENGANEELVIDMFVWGSSLPLVGGECERHEAEAQSLPF